MAHLDFEDFPEDSVHDVAEYIRHAYNINRTLTPKTTKRIDLDAKAIQPCLGYLPLDTVKRTLDCTTQLTHWHTKLPFQRP